MHCITRVFTNAMHCITIICYAKICALQVTCGYLTKNELHCITITFSITLCLDVAACREFQGIVQTFVVSKHKDNTWRNQNIMTNVKVFGQ
jgi:hypothetical protein